MAYTIKKKVTVLMDKDVWQRAKDIERREDKRSISAGIRFILNENDALKKELKEIKERYGVN